MLFISFTILQTYFKLIKLFLVTEGGICEDHVEWESSCKHLKAYCSSFSSMKINCKKTCGFC